MDIRSPLPPDEEPPRPAAQDDWEPEPDDESNPVDDCAFAVPARVIAVKFGVTVLVAWAAAFAPERDQVVVGLAVAVAVAVYAARDLVARVRLRADADGVVVARGYAGRRRLAWDEIERVDVDSRTRLGARASTLEIDADAEIYFFTRNDLGMDPDEALTLLEQVRAKRV